jgi:hypothetical protein
VQSGKPIEECFQAAKNELSLDPYQARRYTGWMRHITLAMLAHALLAAMAAAASKGAAETVPAPWSTSPLRRSAGSWQLEPTARARHTARPARTH